MRTLVCFFAFVACLVSGAATVSAQTITLGDPEREDDLYDGDFAYYISHADCVEEEPFEFSWHIDGLTSAMRVEIWASEADDCADPDERNDSDGDCNRVGDVFTNPEDDQTITIKANEIANAIDGVEDCEDSAVSTEPHVTKLYFLVIDNDAEPVPDGAFAIYEASRVDLLGPEAPTDLSAKEADTSIGLEYTEEASDVLHYRAYCEPKAPASDGGDGGGNSSPSSKPQGQSSGGGGAGGGGGGGEGGAGGGGGEGGEGGFAPANCGTGVLVPGEIPPSEYVCGGEIQSSTGGVVSPLENATEYAIGIAGVDEVGNAGPLSEVICASPVAVIDFYSKYRDAGGQGGCIGGCAVAQDETNPWLFVVGGVVSLAFLRLVSKRARPGKAKRTGTIIGGGVMLLLLAAPSVARADHDIPDTNWRQSHRPTPPAPDTKYAFEVRFGPYWPQVDDEPGLTGKPYEDTFGTDPRFYFGLEFDWMPFRIPYVGTIGFAVGWGYTWASANALAQGCDPATTADTNADDDLGPCETEDVTTLHIMPMHSSVVLRGDELMRRTGVPLVPYGKFGFGWAYWKSSKTAGVSHVDVGDPEDDLYAEDVTIGLHAALGLALALNWLDTASAGSLRESTGIAHAYLFAEWMNAMLTGFGGGQLRAGSSTFVTGLAFDL